MVSIKHLKKGEALMKEGESSNSMYWLQSGTLRLFKKKGTGFIELGVVHAGEVIGEMSFLDSQPRSASVEALQPCDVVEIPRGKFEEFLGTQPSWMKSLVQTLVKRLRATSNRVRELESASTVYTKNEEGRTVKLHEFLSTAETLRLSAALLLAAARNCEAGEGGSRVKAGWVQFYGAQVFGVQLSKIQVFIDVLSEAGVLQIDKKADGVDLVLLDLDRLEKYLHFAQEENSKPQDKQLPLSEKGVAILRAVQDFSDLGQAPASPDTFSVNMEEVFQRAAAASGQAVPFDLTSFEELVKSGFAQEIRVSGTDKTAIFQVARFQRFYPVLALRQRFRDLNTQKREV
jgi:CRP-like cAMP-binding protein